jgi:hypothetical protein
MTGPSAPVVGGFTDLYPPATLASLPAISIIAVPDDRVKEQ